MVFGLHIQRKGSIIMNKKLEEKFDCKIKSMLAKEMVFFREEVDVINLFDIYFMSVNEKIEYNMHMLYRISQDEYLIFPYGYFENYRFPYGILFYVMKRECFFGAIKKKEKIIEIREYKPKYYRITLPYIEDFTAISSIDFQSSNFFIEKYTMGAEVFFEELVESDFYKIMDEIPINVRIGKDNLLPIVYLKKDVAELFKSNKVKVIAEYRNHICLKIMTVYDIEEINSLEDIFILKSTYDFVHYSTVYINNKIIKKMVNES